MKRFGLASSLHFLCFIIFATQLSGNDDSKPSKRDFAPVYVGHKVMEKEFVVPKSVQSEKIEIRVLISDPFNKVFKTFTIADFTANSEQKFSLVVADPDIEKASIGVKSATEYTVRKEDQSQLTCRVYSIHDWKTWKVHDIWKGGKPLLDESPCQVLFLRLVYPKRHEFKLADATKGIPELKAYQVVYLASESFDENVAYETIFQSPNK